ncbi:glutathione S-transferase family protein [Gilvimarinus sp. F26214L]|uniref:glutathione S-transferase family protein n=1 Tax=Gilvimarinus sp. DZF01 TaxID=3461371 RepID=UPI00404667D6
MLKLYGFPISNYYNMVKMALLEKGIEFEEVNTRPSQDESYLSKSPMGKVPALETEQGFLTETDVIFDYLEELGAGPALLPKDPFERAKVRELTKEVELYIELPARTCYKEAFFGGTVTEEVKEKARADLTKGVACLKRNAKFAPYLAGDSFTYADIMFMYSVGLAAICSKRVLGMSLLGDFPEAKALSAKIAERESAQRIAADQEKAA